MKKILLPFILLFIFAMPLGATNLAEAAPKDKCYTQSEMKLKTDMQKLWLDHAWWTRNVIVSKLAGLEDEKPVTNRLLRNQVDIGNAFKLYYGEAAGKQLTALLTEHILIAGNLIDAAKKGDQVNLDKLNKDWYRNADEIVAFLTKLNPHWNKKMLTDMFYLHLKLTTDEVVSRLKKDWESDIKAADLNVEHLIHMADMLTDGIVKQFPKKFK